MKAFLGKQKLKEKAIALSNSAKSLLKFLRIRKFRLHGHASQWLMLKGHLQYSSASCCMVTAWFAGDFSCTSYLKFSLHTIFRFTWMGKVKGNGVCSKRLGSWLTLCWPDTYRCFLNRIAAYLQHASHSMLFKLLDYKRVIWFLPGVAGDQTIGQT